MTDNGHDEKDLQVRGLKQKLTSLAQQRARTKLVEAHREEYQEFYQELRTELFAEHGLTT